MEIEIVFVSNTILEPYLRKYISKAFSTSVSDIPFACVSFEEIHEKQDKLQTAEIIVVCLNFDELYPNAQYDIASRRISYDDIVEDLIIMVEVITLILK